MILETELTLSTAAETLGVNPRTLQSWVQFMPGDRVEGGSGKGSHRRFSFYAIMQAATAIELIELGVSASKAFDAAMAFSHNGGGKYPADFVDDGIQDDEQEHMLALPFPVDKGETYLFVSGGRSVVDLVKDGNLPLTRIKENLGSANSFIALNLTALFFDVATRLGIEDPGVALKAAYAG